MRWGGGRCRASIRFGKISIIFEDLSRNSVFFRTEVKPEIKGSVRGAYAVGEVIFTVTGISLDRFALGKHTANRSILIPVVEGGGVEGLCIFSSTVIVLIFEYTLWNLSFYDVGRGS